MITQTEVYMRLMKKGDTKISPILGHRGQENINNLEDEVARFMETEKTTLYKMGKEFEFLVIIIGKTCYQVNIGDNTWVYLDTDNPVPYD